MKFTPKDFLCASTASKTIVVQKTNADFTIDSITVLKPTFKFFNKSTGTNSSTQYLWDFGDGKHRLKKIQPILMPY